MEHIFQIIIILVLMIRINLIESDYSLLLLYPIKIGTNSTKIEMLVDTADSQTILFSDTNRPYFQKILTKTEMDIYKDNITINDQKFENASFKIEEDRTNLNNTNISGIIGLGISQEPIYSNSFLDDLKLRNLIKYKNIYLTINPSVKISFKNENNLTYTYCELTETIDLDKYYKDGWVCEFTHMQFGLKTDNLSWTDSFEINGRAFFDSKTSFIIAPIEYLEIILHVYELNTTSFCSKQQNEFNETLIKCDFTNKTKPEKMDSFFVIFDGYSYEIPATYLFMPEVNNTYTMRIKFRNENNNIWSFGYPLFSIYDFNLDYDNKKIGLSGGYVLDFNKEYNQWKSKNENFLHKVHNEKTVMIVVGIFGSLILAVILFFVCKEFCNGGNKQLHTELVEENNEH